jgi:hypothetical protein
VSVVNFEEYTKRQSELLDELSALENKDFETKKEYIMQLKDVTIPLITSGYYDGKTMQDLATTVFDLLKKYDVSYPRNDSFYSLFTDEEKKLEKNQYLSTPSRQEISPLPLEKRSGDEVIDKLKQSERTGFDIPQGYAFGTYLSRVMETSGENIKQAQSVLRKLGNAIFYVNEFTKVFTPESIELEIGCLVGKKKKELQERYDYYLKCQNNIQDIETGMGDVMVGINDLTEVLADQKHTSKQLDERNKITFIEKWNAIVLSKIAVNLSAVAKRLNIDKKHMTNNIIPKENPVTGSKNNHHQYANWFQCIQVETPEGNFTINVKEYFDKQIERGKLNLEFKPLLLTDYKVE